MNYAENLLKHKDQDKVALYAASKYGWGNSVNLLVFLKFLLVSFQGPIHLQLSKSPKSAPAPCAPSHVCIPQLLCLKNIFIASAPSMK